MKFTIESDNSNNTCEVEKSVATVKYRTEGFFASLEDHVNEESFTYRWNHAGGKGEFKIPSHIMYDLPHLILCLSKAREETHGIGIMEKCRIYQTKPVAEY